MNAEPAESGLKFAGAALAQARAPAGLEGAGP